MEKKLPRNLKINAKNDALFTLTKKHILNLYIDGENGFGIVLKKITQINEC